MKYTIFLFLIILLSSCHRTIYFTEDLRRVVEVNNLDMKKIQFYNSRNVKFIREVNSEEAKVAKGKITISNGKIIEEILLSRETNGMCTSFGQKNLTIAFEEGVNNGFNFEKSGDFYVLALKSPKSNQLVYNKKEYNLTEGVGCKLKVKKSQFRKLKKSVRRLKGIKVE